MAVLKSVLPGALTKKRLYIWGKEYKNEIAIALLIIVIFLVSQFLSPVFLTANNLLNLLRQTAYTAIAAVGMYFVILIGGIDLSIGATVQIVGMTSIMMLVIVAVAFFMMKKTTFGRRLYITGSNQTAAYYSGTNVRRIKVMAYVLCALFATVSGLLSVARIGAFQPTTTHGGATGMELNAIAAVVVGGASLAGGKGSVIGTLLGALLYGILSNLFPLIGVSSYFQQLIQGFIILMAVLISSKGKIFRKITRGKEVVKDG